MNTVYRGMRSTLAIVLTALLLGGSIPLYAQQPGGSGGMGGPPSYVINNIRVEGVENQRTRQFVFQSSGLSTGQTITLPSGDAIPEAIRSVYEVGVFSDVAIYEENRQGNRVDLIIEVVPEPTLVSYKLEGIRDRHEDDLKEKIPLVGGQPVRPSDIERTKQIIKQFYGDKGYLRTEVDVERSTRETGNVDLTFNVDRNEEVEVHRIRFSGNERFDDGDLRGAMEETKENRWWRFWSGEKFDQNLYEDDLQLVIDHYREHGYYDAQIVSDSVYYIGDGGMAIDVSVREGHQYYVRSLDWEGNTIYSDQTLTERLGLREGEVYNAVAMEKNLRGNRKGTDVLGLYMDRGYMRADVQPTVRVAGEDSLDITFDVREGDVYTFGDIEISGNTKTHDYVIRRELYTVPGERFSRSAIQESIRRLSQLSYFSKQSLQGGPELDVDQEEKEANLTYSVKEVGSDQLELSGTYGRRRGIILQLGFKFNNFSAQNFFNGSAWRPLPSGDGQKLSMNVRTSGSAYQNYSLSFTEPWFRGRPTPIGGSVSFSQYKGGIYRRRSSVENGRFRNFSSSLFIRQRLDWPDDKFETGTTVSYRRYDNRGFITDSTAVGGRRNVGLFRSIPSGQNKLVSIQQTFSRNSLDNPRFPSSGSQLQLSLEVAPPLPGFEQYHKWGFTTNWNVPLGENFSFGVGTNFGYIGSITGDPVAFEEFEVGGTAFDYQGRNFGTDPVYVRGYPRGVIGPKVRGQRGLEPAGARVLNKYTSEVRWMAVESQQLQARPYVYLDAVGAWKDLRAYNPSNLYRSTGIGIKLFLPIVGTLEFNYGYNFDRFIPLGGSGDEGAPSWSFQFSIGQGTGGR